MTDEKAITTTGKTKKTKATRMRKGFGKETW